MATPRHVQPQSRPSPKMGDKWKHAQRPGRFDSTGAIKKLKRKRPKYVYPTQRPRKGAGRQGRQKTKKAPVDPFEQEVEAALHLKYDPQVREIEHERQVVAQQGANAQGWYQDYLNELGKAAASQNAYYQQAQQGVYAAGTQAATADTQRMGQVQQDQQQSAAIRGTVATPQPEIQAGISARQASGNSFGGLIGAQGGAAATLAAGEAQRAAASRLGALQQGTNRLDEINQIVRDLAAQQGSDKVNLRQELAESALKQQAIRAEFGLKTRAQLLAERKAKTEARDKRRRARLTKRGQNVTARGQKRSAATQRRGQDVTRQNAQERLDFDRQKEAWDRAHPNAGKGGGKNPGGLTDTQLRKVRSHARGGAKNGFGVLRVASDLEEFDGLSHKVALKIARQAVRKYGDTNKGIQRGLKKLKRVL